MNQEEIEKRVKDRFDELCKDQEFNEKIENELNIVFKSKGKRMKGSVKQYIRECKARSMMEIIKERNGT